MILGALARGALCPAAVAAVVLALTWWRGEDRGHRGGAAAVGLGYAAGHAALAGWPPLPPIEATDWLPYLGLGAALVALLTGVRDEPGAGSWARRAAFAVAVPALVSWPLVRGSWSTAESALWLGVPAGLALALLVLLERAGGAGGFARALPLAVAAAGGSAVIVASGSALVGQLAGALAAVMGVCLAAAWARPWRPILGAAFSFGVLFCALIVCGIHYVRMPLGSATLLVVGLAAALALQAGPLSRAAAWKSAGIACALVIAAAAAAFILAWTSVEGYGDYGQG
jgi:hypothetical protein